MNATAGSTTAHDSTATNGSTPVNDLVTNTADRFVKLDDDTLGVVLEDFHCRDLAAVYYSSDRVRSYCDQHRLLYQAVRHALELDVDQYDAETVAILCRWGIPRTNEVQTAYSKYCLTAQGKLGYESGSYGNGAVTIGHNVVAIMGAGAHNVLVLTAAGQAYFRTGNGFPDDHLPLAITERIVKAIVVDGQCFLLTQSGQVYVTTPNLSKDVPPILVHTGVEDIFGTAHCVAIVYDREVIVSSRALYGASVTVPAGGCCRDLIGCGPTKAYLWWPKSIQLVDVGLQTAAEPITFTSLVSDYDNIEAIEWDGKSKLTIKYTVAGASKVHKIHW